MFKQWISIWLWDMWYYVSLIISFVSFGIYGSYGGRFGVQCVVRNFILRSLCVGEKWLGWEPLFCIMIIYVCIWPYCRHAPRLTWDCIREVVTLDSKVEIWKVRSRYKNTRELDSCVGGGGF